MIVGFAKNKDFVAETMSSELKYTVDVLIKVGATAESEIVFRAIFVRGAYPA